jgi:hypothetical protein
MAQPKKPRPRKLTKQQAALVRLIYYWLDSDCQDIATILGPNHPTVKWWRKATGLKTIVGVAAWEKSKEMMREMDRDT